MGLDTPASPPDWRRTAYSKGPRRSDGPAAPTSWLATAAPSSLLMATRKPGNAWASTRKSRHERGYGREHDRMRKIVLREEPLCRMCLALGRVSAATIADHIIPLSEGGTGERDNYQGLDADCHRKKTAEEAARAKGVKAPRHRRAIGSDGWPTD